MAKQTRRSISVKASTEWRIRQYAKDTEVSSSAFVEGVISEKLGDPTVDDVSVYEAHQARPSDPPKDEPSLSSEIGLSPSEPATDLIERPTHNQPKHKPAEITIQRDEKPESAKEMEGYVPPNLLF